MADKLSKGFYKDLGGLSTFEVKAANPTTPAVLKPGKDGIVIDIGADKTSLQKIFITRKKPGELTGNKLIDGYNKLNDLLISSSKIQTRDMAAFFRLLAVMINAGIPLIKSLNTLAVQSSKLPKLKKVLFALAKKLEGGISLSKAMLEFPEVFSEAQVGAIQAGEASGQLNKTLLDLASELEKNASIAGKVKGAMIYPVAIILLMAGVVTLMMVMVIPQLKDLFAQSGKDLPIYTQYMISLSDFMVGQWYILLALLIASAAGFMYWKKTKTGKYYWDYFLISVPVFGELVKKSLLSKFSHSFGNLLSSGVPIIKAIEIVATASGNEVYRKRLLLSAEDMKGGIPLAESMSSSNLFPTMLVNMLEVGEQTAQLENVTRKVAEFYDEEVDNAVKSLTKLMEPLIMIVMGVVVGGLVAAIMLPIIQLTDIGNSI